MDSGNSGSIQSSSGGDEEYESRAADSFSAFMNPTTHVGPISNPQPPHHTPTSPMFDPLSNYFDTMSRPAVPPLQNPSSLLNLDMLWSKPLRSDLNCTEINPMLGSSSSFQPFFGSSTSQSPKVSFPPAMENVTPRASSSSATSDQTHLVRNPKKRSRASRRAPTTVLTTDTTNFRAMVQEFTGIPAPPFTSSPFPRNRFDLFGTPSSMRSSPIDTSQQPSYLLRPFAQKLQPPPFVSSSSSSSLLGSSVVDSIASNSANNIASGSTISGSNSTTVNYQLPSELDFLKQAQGSPILNMQNPILTFQSLLQPPPKYPVPNSSILGSKAHGSLEISSNDSHLKLGSLDEFSLTHGQVNTNLTGLHSLISSDGNASRNDNNQANWVDGVGSKDDDQAHLRFSNGGYNSSQNVTKGKLNYSASSSNFHGDKRSGNGSTRGEGMVESWICSSD